MGFAIVHMEKHQASVIRGIQSHNRREHESKTNPDIDKGRTPDNYDLVCNDNYLAFIKDTIKNYASKTKTPRKNAVVMSSFLITSDHETMKAMTPEQQREFFRDSVEWFAERYGRHKIANATIHIDERTPHMHLGIVPITEDGRLSAKELFDRKELRAIQTDFPKEVGRKYGLKRGVEGSEATHLSEVRFKTATARAELSELQESIEDLKKEETSLECDIEAYEELLSEPDKVVYPKSLGQYSVPTGDGRKIICHAVPVENYKQLQDQVTDAGRVLKDAQESLILRGALAVERKKAESLEDEKAKHERLLEQNPELKELYEIAQREREEKRRKAYRQHNHDFQF